MCFVGGGKGVGVRSERREGWQIGEERARVGRVRLRCFGG